MEIEIHHRLGSCCRNVPLAIIQGHPGFEGQRSSAGGTTGIQPGVRNGKLRCRIVQLLKNKFKDRSLRCSGLRGICRGKRFLHKRHISVECDQIAIMVSPQEFRLTLDTRIKRSGCNRLCLFHVLKQGITSGDAGISIRPDPIHNTGIGSVLSKTDRLEIVVGPKPRQIRSRIQHHLERTILLNK